MNKNDKKLHQEAYELLETSIVSHLPDIDMSQAHINIKLDLKHYLQTCQSHIKYFINDLTKELKRDTDLSKDDLKKIVKQLTIDYINTIT
jgi:hypothetical protein